MCDDCKVLARAPAAPADAPPSDIAALIRAERDAHHYRDGKAYSRGFNEGYRLGIDRAALVAERAAPAVAPPRGAPNEDEARIEWLKGEVRATELRCERAEAALREAEALSETYAARFGDTYDDGARTVARKLAAIVRRALSGARPDKEGT